MTDDQITQDEIDDDPAPMQLIDIDNLIPQGPSGAQEMPPQGSPVMAGIVALLILRGCADDRLEDVMAIIGDNPIPPTMNGMLDEIDDAIREVMGR